MSVEQVLGTVGGLVLALAAVQVWRVNTTLLPRELKPPWWRQLMLAICAAFYGALSAAVVWDQAAKWWK